MRPPVIADVGAAGREPVPSTRSPFPDDEVVFVEPRASEAVKKSTKRHQCRTHARILPALVARTAGFAVTIGASRPRCFRICTRHPFAARYAGRHVRRRRSRSASASALTRRSSPSSIVSSCGRSRCANRPGSPWWRRPRSSVTSRTTATRYSMRSPLILSCSTACSPSATAAASPRSPSAIRRNSSIACS